MFVFQLFSQNNSTDIIGLWYTEDNEGIVEIYQKQNAFYGKFLWIENRNNTNGEDIKDVMNPKPELRNQLLVGSTFMYGFKYNKDEVSWCDGEIYDPRSGYTYSAYIHLQDKNTLLLRGYLGFSVFGKTTTWIRKTD